MSACKASVLTITYNHAPFIAKALQSALDQRTSFDYEIVVADDLSSDGTREIVNRYHEAHPDRIRLVPRREHVGMYQNAVDAYRACRGEYLAILEGDDYWISPTKLQRQIDFLENHRDCSVCFTNALMVYEDGGEALYCPPDMSEFSELEDMLLVNFIPTCTVVYRNLFMREFPEWTRNLIIGDWVLNILHAQHGRIGYISDTTAVFRKHRGGVWTGATTEAKKATMKSMFGALNEHFDYKYDRLIRVLIARWLAFHDLEDLRAKLSAAGREIEQLRLDKADCTADLYARIGELEQEQQSARAQMVQFDLHRRHLEARLEQTDGFTTLLRSISDRLDALQRGVSSPDESR